MTLANRPPPFSQLPDGLVNGSKVFEEILAALPQRELAVIDIPSRAERYMYLSSEYMTELHTKKYRKTEMDNSLKDIRKKGYALLDALRRSGAAIVDAYNAIQLGPEPTLGEMERMAEAFVLALDRVSVPEDNERGPKSNKSLRLIVQQAAKDFEEITGCKPDRSLNRDSFTDFVKNLFNASGVKKAPEQYVRETVEE